MKLMEFEHWTFRFDTADVSSALLVLDYITTTFITYILPHFLGDFTHRICYKMVKNGFNIKSISRFVRKSIFSPCDSVL